MHINISPPSREIPSSPLLFLLEVGISIHSTLPASHYSLQFGPQRLSALSTLITSHSRRHAFSFPFLSLFYFLFFIFYFFFLIWIHVFYFIFVIFQNNPFNSVIK